MYRSRLVFTRSLIAYNLINKLQSTFFHIESLCHHEYKLRIYLLTLELNLIRNTWIINYQSPPHFPFPSLIWRNIIQKWTASFHVSDSISRSNPSSSRARNSLSRWKEKKKKKKRKRRREEKKKLASKFLEVRSRGVKIRAGTFRKEEGRGRRRRRRRERGLEAEGKTSPTKFDRWPSNDWRRNKARRRSATKGSRNTEWRSIEKFERSAQRPGPAI